MSKQVFRRASSRRAVKRAYVALRDRAPVDLAHADRLGRALACAADLARHWGAKVVFVGASAETPSTLSHDYDPHAELGSLSVFPVFGLGGDRYRVVRKRKAGKRGQSTLDFQIRDDERHSLRRAGGRGDDVHRGSARTA